MRPHFLAKAAQFATTKDELGRLWNTKIYDFLKFLCSYPSYITPTPGKKGRVIWFTGAPGAGKSTTAQMMANEKDYRYYEADCMMSLTNPFLDIHAENVFNAQVRAKPLAVSDENHRCLCK